jgi:hypothetical protein
MHRYPLITAAMANPIPVFPLVPSMMTPPGFNAPLVSASSIILSAIRSLIELPGFVVSTLAYTVHGKSLVMELSFTIGVFPMVSKMFWYTRILMQIYF